MLKCFQGSKAIVTADVAVIEKWQRPLWLFLLSSDYSPQVHLCVFREPSLPPPLSLSLWSEVRPFAPSLRLGSLTWGALTCLLGITSKASCSNYWCHLKVGLVPGSFAQTGLYNWVCQCVFRVQRHILHWWLLSGCNKWLLGANALAVSTAVVAGKCVSFHWFFLWARSSPLGWAGISFRHQLLSHRCCNSFWELGLSPSGSFANSMVYCLSYNVLTVL